MIVAKGAREEEVSCEVVLYDGLARRVLESAVNDYLAYDAGERIYDDSQRWLFSDFEETEDDRAVDAANGFVSLFTICEMLDVDHEKLRVFVRCKRDRFEGREPRQVRRLVDSQFDEMFEACR